MPSHTGRGPSAQLRSSSSSSLVSLAQPFNALGLTEAPAPNSSETVYDSDASSHLGARPRPSSFAEPETGSKRQKPATDTEGLFFGGTFDGGVNADASQMSLDNALASFGKLPTPPPPVGLVQPSPTTGEELRQLEALAISITPPLDDVAHAVGQGMTSAALRNPTDEIILKLCDAASATFGGPAIPALRLTLQRTSSAFCASIALEGGPSAIRKRIAYFRALEEEFEAIDRLCSVLSAL
ncbi:uncharacterized protein JCM10292_002530 [Rhodotorula paludigena]|uniref:uncharacterized protein n=1 Tax=Rhodotorula paludigena TaxID=86838 RepID=UPI00317485E6